MMSPLIWCGPSGAAVFDSTTLNLDGYWRANSTTGYDNGGGSGIWLAVGSAGASGSNGNCTEATNFPAEATLNGHTGPDFDGTNDMLGNSNAVSTFLTASRWWAACLFKVDSFTTNVAAVYDNAALWQDAGGFVGFSVKGSGASGTCHIWQYDGTADDTSVSISTGTTYLAVGWYDGSNLNLIVNATTASTAASGNITSLTSTLRVGRNYASAYHDGQIYELALSKSTYGSSEAASFKSYVNSRYGLSL